MPRPPIQIQETHSIPPLVKVVSDRIIIEVLGGNVLAVYSSNDDVKISILDHDNLNKYGTPKDKKTSARLEKEIKQLTRVF